MKNYITTAIVCTTIFCVALFGTIIKLQTDKQDSIERQKQMEINQQQAELDYKKELEDKKDKEEDIRKSNLSICLADATSAYWDYMELNGTKKDDGSIWASNYIWEQAQDRKEKLEEVCFKKSI